MKSGRKIQVALECRIDDPRSGNGSAILSLAHALSRSTIDDQEYTFIIYKSNRAWLEPHIFGPCRLAALEKPGQSGFRRTLGGITPLRKAWAGMKTRIASVPASDGYVESNQFDVVHFPTPIAYSTLCPTIYQPCDLQHVHYPQFFSKADFALRERLYREFCDRAQSVCVQTEWSKQDVVRQFHIDPDKIEVIRWGPVFEAYEYPSAQEKQATQAKYNLPHEFFFYPAVTWPHKNHEDIIRAIHLLKTEHGRQIDVYFTGALTDFHPRLEQLARELDITGQIHYLGFVTAKELQSIFSAATAMVFASRFEGFGLPILEAFQAGLPVLSSNASVLPEVAKDGALYFTPGAPSELAQRMMQLLRDQGLRKSLAARGSEVLSRFSLHEMARQFQQLYARVAGQHAAASQTEAIGVGHPNKRSDSIDEQ